MPSRIRFRKNKYENNATQQAEMPVYHNKCFSFTQIGYILLHMPMERQRMAKDELCIL